MNLVRLARVTLRAEALRLLRTREVYTFLLLPALLLVPLSMAGVALVRSLLDSPPVVAIPLDTPAELDLQGELESRQILAMPHADPEAALDAGEVDAAIVRWVEGDGVGPAHGPGPARWRWRAELAGGDAELQDEVSGAVEDAGDAALEAWATLSGGDPARDVWVAELVAMPAKKVDLERRLGGFLVAYGVFVLGLIGVMTVVGFTAADRAEGVTESLATTGAPPWVGLASRVAVVTLVQGAAAAALLASVSVAADVNGLRIPWPPMFALRLGAALFTCNALFLLIGVAAPGVRLALGVASYALLGAGLVLGWGVFDAPAAVPLAGLVSARTPADLGIALLAALALSALAFAAAVAALGPSLRRSVG